MVQCSNRSHPLLIVQYPYGKPLKLALDMQGVIGFNANGTRIRYATQTEPAASGSPCFALDWTLVALHHYGDPLFGHPSYNQGVPIGMIRDRLIRLGKADALGGAAVIGCPQRHSSARPTNLARSAAPFHVASLRKRFLRFWHANMVSFLAPPRQ